MKARLQAWASTVQGWLPVRVVMAFGASQASNYASALAFNAILSMFPLMLGILAIVGLSIRDPATEAKVQTLMIQSFPGTAHDELLGALHGVKQSAGLFGLVSIAGLLWSASGIFASMEFVFAQIFGIQQRDMIRQKLMGFVMMTVLIVAVGLTVGANTVAAWVPSAWLPFSWLPSFVIGSLVMMTLLTLLYRLVPNRSYPIRHILPGALLAGVLIEALSLGWTLYANISHGFNTYGKEFALFFVLAAWFYLLSNLILLGAVYNKFRLGEPMKGGLIATPQHQARTVQKPLDAIEQHKQHAPAVVEQPVVVAAPERATAPRRPPLPRRLAGYVVVGLAIFPRLLRRRGSHSIEA